MKLWYRYFSFDEGPVCLSAVERNMATAVEEGDAATDFAGEGVKV